VGGFDGPELPDEMQRALAEGRRGGIILFTRNAPDVETVHELCSKIVDAAPDELPPFIAVDQEGGRVSRLPEPVLRLPPMRELGRRGDPALVKKAGLALGRELAAIGLNLDFAPVLDVDSNPDNPVIGDRAFGSDPDTVARLGRAFIEGLQSGGVMACGKHFPGHGDTSKDSHVDLPHVDCDKQRLDTVELPPFRTASLRGVKAMMSAHVIYEELDPGLPATLSRKICTGLLRSEIGFKGVLFSDCLQMRALSDRWPIEETSVAAVRAGCDVVLVCHDFDLQERAHHALVARAEADPQFRARCNDAVARALRARREQPPRPVPSRDALASAFGSAEAAEVLAAVTR
jgi:beta-N-acetylhexosaminidase